MYREENKLSWFYSSKGYEDDLHRITIPNCNGNPVYICKLCYKQLPPTRGFTISTAFPNSESFTKSISFSNSETFTTSQSFSASTSFSLSISFSVSTDFHYPTGSDTKSKTQTNIIIGVCVAIFALLAIVIIYVFLYLRKQKQSEVENQDLTVYEADASTINLVFQVTQEDDIDTIANSLGNDLFGEMMMSDE